MQSCSSYTFMCGRSCWGKKGTRKQFMYFAKVYLAFLSQKCEMLLLCKSCNNTITTAIVIRSLPLALLIFSSFVPGSINCVKRKVLQACARKARKRWFLLFHHQLSLFSLRKQIRQNKNQPFLRLLSHTHRNLFPNLLVQPYHHQWWSYTIQKPYT